MRFDPRLRLKRPLPGNRFHIEKAWIELVFRRTEQRSMGERAANLLPRRDLKESRFSLKTRPKTRLANPGPNAPLLIRLVRYRFALQKAKGQKKKYRDIDELNSLKLKKARMNWHQEVRDALAERVRMRSTSPARTRPRPFALRPSRWKLLPDLISS